jgi:glyceraldehyde 3-phosphate dehydrogenase
VLVSASKTLQDCGAVLLPGINMEQFDPGAPHRQHGKLHDQRAPVVKVLIENFGIQMGLFSTVHAYTNTQSLTDQPMRDRRDSWAAAENIIPSSSGAAKALKFIWPDLNITGKAYRVPARTGSIAELNVIVERATTVDEVNAVFRKLPQKAPLKGVMDVLEDEWTSARIVGDPHSSIVDLPLTQVLDGSFVSVAAWYDNEMGYSARLAETAALLAG